MKRTEEDAAVKRKEVVAMCLDVKIKQKEKKHSF